MKIVLCLDDSGQVKNMASNISNGCLEMEIPDWYEAGLNKALTTDRTDYMCHEFVTFLEKGDKDGYFTFWDRTRLTTVVNVELTGLPSGIYSLSESNNPKDSGSFIHSFYWDNPNQRVLHKPGDNPLCVETFAEMLIRYPSSSCLYKCTPAGDVNETPPGRWISNLLAFIAFGSLFLVLLIALIKTNHLNCTQSPETIQCEIR